MAVHYFRTRPTRRCRRLESVLIPKLSAKFVGLELETATHTYIHTYKDHVVTATQSANRVNIPKGMAIPTVAMTQSQ